MRSRPVLDMTATVVSVAGPRDGSLIALLPGDSRRFAAIAMTPPVAEGVLIGLLHHFNRFTQPKTLSAESAHEPLAGVPVQKLDLAADDTGQALLTVSIGAAHLRLLLNPAALRKLASCAARMVGEQDQQLPSECNHSK